MFRRLVTRIGTLETAPPWGIGAALSTVVAAFAATVLGTTLGYMLVSEEAQFAMLLGWTIGAALIVVFVVTTRRAPTDSAALRLAGQPAATITGQTLLLVLIGVGLAIALDVVTGRITGLFLPDPELYNVYVVARLYGQPVTVASWVLGFAYMVLFQPLAEELVFRGVVQPALRQVVGAWPGYVITSALYGAFHLLAYPVPVGAFNGLWYGIIVPFLAGLIFGAVRLYTGSTRAAILAHGAFGLFALVKLLTLTG